MPQKERQGVKGLQGQRRKYAIFGLLGLLILGGLYGLFALWENQKNHRSLVLYGNVDIRQVELGFRVGGRLMHMNFEEGDAVKTGNVMAILDKAPYEADLEQAQAQLAQLEANYAKLTYGSRPQEIEEARATVAERKAAYENANTIYKREKKQLKTGATSQQDYDIAEAQMKETKALLKNAEEALSLAEEGFRIEDIEAGRADVERAKALVESAQINLEDTEIIAPSDGIILTRVREPGAIVASGAIVYTLTLHKPVWVCVYVSETDLGRVKPGMSAFVTNDAHPNDPFKGHVGFISPQAEFTPKNVETPELRTDLVYRVRLVINDPEGELRQGMPVTATIQLKP